MLIISSKKPKTFEKLNKFVTKNFFKNKFIAKKKTELS